MNFWLPAPFFCIVVGKKRHWEATKYLKICASVLSTTDKRNKRICVAQFFCQFVDFQIRCTRYCGYFHSSGVAKAPLPFPIKLSKLRFRGGGGDVSLKRTITSTREPAISSGERNGTTPFGKTVTSCLMAFSIVFFIN